MFNLEGACIVIFAVEGRTAHERNLSRVPSDPERDSLGRRALRQIQICFDPS